MAAAPVPDVFLSHNSRDKPEVERVAERLRRVGLEPWLDSWALTSGGRWQEEIVEGLRASRACAVFIGPHGLGDWVREELAVALDRAAKDRTFRLFPVLLPGAGEPFDPTTLPHFLATRTWVDLRAGSDDPRAFQALVNAVQGVAYGGVQPLVEPGVCPYRGLEAFEAEQAEFFFGRDADVQRLLERLKETRFLAVLGASGTGKSSLVRAGLVPALQAGRLPGSTQWQVRVFKPGARPLTELAAELTTLNPTIALQPTLDGLLRDDRTLDLAGTLALRGLPDTARVVLVIDQFEEVFTLCRDEVERQAFFANLLHAGGVPGGRCVVLLTLRADFYPRCAAYPELAAVLAARQFLVSPLDAAGLRQAIEEPARLVGLEFEQGLVETILADVANQPGALPLLEFALLELWNRRSGSMLTLEGYRRSGGVAGALARRADAVYGALDAEGQAAARRVLLRLTQPGDGAEDTRRRAQLSELTARRGGEPDAGTEQVVQALVAARLLTLSSDDAGDEQTVDVAHEALIRGWPTLRGWIDEDRAGLREQRRITDAALEWQRSGRDESALFRGSRLAAAREWVARAGNADTLNDLEREFIAAGERAAARERELARRRVRLAFAGLTVALLLIAGVAALALLQRRDALAQADARATAEAVALVERDAAQQAQATALAEADARATAESAALNQAATAEAARNEALAGALAASSDAALASDPELGLLLAREALGVMETTAGKEALRAALVASRVRQRLELPGNVLSVEYHRDGVHLLTLSADNVVRIWDLSGSAPPLVLSAEPVPAGPSHVLFSRDGSRVLVASGTTVQVWDWQNLQIAGTLEVPEALAIEGIARSYDGRYLALVEAAGAVSIYALPALEFVSRVAVPVGIDVVALDNIGGTLVIGGASGTARVYDWRDGTLLVELAGHRGAITAVAFDPIGRYLLTASDDWTVRVWDWQANRTIATLTEHRARVISATFDPSGQFIVSGSVDASAIVWNWQAGQVEAHLLGHNAVVTAVAFSADGQRVATGSDDDSVRIWAWSPFNLRALLTHQISTEPLFGQILSLAFHPDGTRLLGVSLNGTAIIYDWQEGRALETFGRAEAPVQRAAWSHDGDLLVTSNSDGYIYVYEVADRRLLAVLPVRFAPDFVAFSPDDALVIASRESRIESWDWRTGRVGDGLGITELSPIHSTALSHDGRLWAIGGAGGTVWMVDWQSREVATTSVSYTGGPVWSIAFSPDDRYLVTGYEDGRAIVWDVETQQQLATLEGHRARVRGAAFSADGQFVITVSDDGTARAWEWADAGAGIVVGQAQVELTALALDGHSGLFAVGDANGVIRVNDCDICVPLPQLLDLAQARLTRDLTPAERVRYLP